jgi:hypothetical protein
VVTNNYLVIIIAGAGLAFSQLLGIIGSFLICCSEFSEPCGTGCIEEETITRLFKPTAKKVAKVQIETPMLVVIPQSQ